MEKVSGRSNVFIISKRQSSLSNKFYDRSQTLQAEAIYYIVRIDWPDWLVLYHSSQHLIASATKCKRGIHMFHWMLVAPQALKSVLPVADSFTHQEMCTFSRIRAHQSASETFNLRFWRRKTKPASVNYFDIVAQATNKTCAFPWQVSVFSVLWNIMVQKWLFITISKTTCFILQPIFPHFFRYIGWPEGPETDIVGSSDSVSHHIYRVFRLYVLTFFCYCTAGWTKHWSKTSSVDDVSVKTHKTKSLFTCPIYLMNISQFP